jgi:acyl-CoA reductase-like NAD-dependent aldehyde dehydrogenase
LQQVTTEYYKPFARYIIIDPGCAAVIKPSELSPAVSRLLADLFPKYMDTDLFRVVNGAKDQNSKASWAYSFVTLVPMFISLVAGVEVGPQCVLSNKMYIDTDARSSFLSSVHWSVLERILAAFDTKRCRHSFVGGERVAKIVATAAAKHLTPLTLEV